MVWLQVFLWLSGFVCFGSAIYINASSGVSDTAKEALKERDFYHERYNEQLAANSRLFNEMRDKEIKEGVKQVVITEWKPAHWRRVGRTIELQPPGELVQKLFVEDWNPVNKQ